MTGLPRWALSFRVSPPRSDTLKSEACLGRGGRIRSRSRTASSSPLTLAVRSRSLFAPSPCAVDAEAGSRGPSASRAKSEMPTRAAPATIIPVSISLSRIPTPQSFRACRKKLAKVYQHGSGADLLRPGRLHIVGGPGWPARVLTDEQTRRRKHAPADGTPDGHRQEDDLMDERQIHDLIADVRAARLSRRAFTRLIVGLGLSAPIAAQLLGAGKLGAQPRSDGFAPTRRGGGGQLKVLWWQAPTLLNPHFAVGTKDQDGSRVFYEPLAAFDPEGNLFPFLAQEIPTVDNGGLARDGKSVTWKLKRGVTWHDGKPFTADDLVFNWEYAADPASAAVTITTYRDIERVEKVDSHTVRLSFKNPTPFWFDAFCGARGMIIPKHLFQAFKGDKSREAPTNLKPVGTGPYRFVDFRPGDLVRGEINPAYHVPNRPFFDQFEMKGGGDAASAARAVLQTGEFDFAWNMQVADDVLKRFEQGGKGHLDIATGGAIEHMQLNNTDPWKEVDGERSSIKTTHPFLTDPAVRSALNLLVDRGAIHEEIYGRQGQATPNFLNGPPRFRSANMRWEFSVDRANQILDG